jgi:3-oxoadipate enol-lactonase
MPKVKVGDINMYYEIHGSGEPLAFISGLGSTTEGAKQLLRLPVLSREYRVVLFDNRGAGRSEAPDAPFTFNTMADDLAGLLDAIGVDSAHIMGASMGGGIAQHFALRHPRMVISLVLMCASCGGTHRIPSDDEYTRLSNSPELLKMPMKERSKLMLPFLVNQDFIDKNPKIVQRFLTKRTQIKYPTPPQGYMRHRQAIMAHDTYERLTEIKAPTLVINGDADRVVPVENARILASRIPNAELKIFKNTGHGMIEAGEELNRIILDFLRRHSTKRA